MAILEILNAYGPILVSLPQKGVYTITVTRTDSQGNNLSPQQSFCLTVETIAHNTTADIQQYVQALMGINEQSIVYSVTVENKSEKNTPPETFGKLIATRASTQPGEANNAEPQLGLITDFPTLYVYNGYPGTVSVLSNGGVQQKLGGVAGSKLARGIHTLPLPDVCNSAEPKVEVTVPAPSYTCSYTGYVCATTTPRYTVTVVSEDESKGEAKDSGTVPDGGCIYISVAAYSGYTFEGWYYNGLTRLEGLKSTDTFTPTESCTLVAKFISKYTCAYQRYTCATEEEGSTYPFSINIAGNAHQLVDRMAVVLNLSDGSTLYHLFEQGNSYFSTFNILNGLTINHIDMKVDYNSGTPPKFELTFSTSKNELNNTVIIGDNGYLHVPRQVFSPPISSNGSNSLTISINTI